jgi:hypothetical protein
VRLSEVRSPNPTTAVTSPMHLPTFLFPTPVTEETE